MRFDRVVLLIAGCFLAVTGPAQAQYSPPVPAARQLQFESWRAPSLVEANSKLTIKRLDLGSKNRTRQALLGGAIGAAAGFVTCTVFSTLIDDSAEGGLSFCPLDTNLLFVGAGFVLGAAIGWAI
jgi:hypothetical protein